MAYRDRGRMKKGEELSKEMKRRSVNRRVKKSPVMAGSKAAADKARAAYTRPTAKPKPPGPTTIAAAKRAGAKNFYRWENGKWAKKAAVTAGDLQKSGHKTLGAYLRAGGKSTSKPKTSNGSTTKKKVVNNKRVVSTSVSKNDTKPSVARTNKLMQAGKRIPQYLITSAEGNPSLLNKIKKYNEQKGFSSNTKITLGSRAKSWLKKSGASGELFRTK